MAKAIENIQRHLECSVCMETYTNPHWLKCGHTFCLHCIQPLVNDNQVSCPNCRKYTARQDICKDYNTAQLVQLLREGKEENLPPGKGTTKCDLCQDPNKYATKFCQVCKEMMCHECTRAHQGSKATRDHKIKTLDDIIENIKSKITASIKTLNEHKQELGKRHTDIENVLSNLRSEQDKTCAEIDLNIDLMINKLESYRIELKNQVKANDGEYLLNIEDCKKNIDDMVRKIEAKISAMQAIITTHDLDVLQDSLNNLKAGVHFPNVPDSDDSSVKWLIVNNASQFNANNYISLTKKVSVQKNELNISQDLHVKNITNKEYKRGELDYRCLIGKRLVKVNKVNTLNILRLCIANGSILQTNRDNSDIHVCNQDGNKVTEIKHPNIIAPCGMCTTDQSIIVASESGLHEINTDVSYNKQISSDKYYDVFFYQGNLYALNQESPCVDVFKFTGGKCKLETPIKVNEVKFKTSYMAGYNRIVVSDQKITVSTYYGVYKYTHYGKLLEHIQCRHGFGAGEFGSDVYLCGVDQYNNHLYADNGFNRLQLQDNNNDWSVIQLPEGILGPRDVKLDQSAGVLWIGTWGGLCKITI